MDDLNSPQEYGQTLYERLIRDHTVTICGDIACVGTADDNIESAVGGIVFTAEYDAETGEYYLVAGEPRAIVVDDDDLCFGTICLWANVPTE